MTTFAVIVTYGNRFHLLKQVIDNALAEGAIKIIVVDNNSAQESKEKLKAYENELGSNKIKVLYLDDNYGSAGGFKRGIEEAYNDPQCDFIWLFDDDNVPENGALRKLLEVWNNLECDNKTTMIALCSYRKKLSFHLKTIGKDNKDITLGPKNSFLGFSVKYLPIKIIRFIRRLIESKIKKQKELRSLDRIDGIVSFIKVAPYGGMFFHKDLINKIGFPNENFFIYADDHEWSYRITKSGGKIILVFGSIINDIETSWHLEKLSIFHSIKEGPKLRVYYSIRNRVYFEKHNLIENFTAYKLNIFVFKLILKFFIDKERYTLVSRAIEDGLNGKLGKIKI